MAETIEPDFEVAVIANNGTTSTWVDLRGRQLVAIVFPAAITSATVQFKGRYLSAGNGNTITEKKSATDYSSPIAAGKWVPLDVDVFCGVSQVQLVVDLNEAAERSITLITRPVN
jgi:hypothetical protein